MKINRLIGFTNKDMIQRIHTKRCSQLEIFDYLSLLTFNNTQKDISGYCDQDVLNSIGWNAPHMNLNNLRVFLSKVPSNGIFIYKIIFKMTNINLKKIDFLLDYMNKNTLYSADRHHFLLSLSQNYGIQKNSYFLKYLLEYYIENEKNIIINDDCLRRFLLAVSDSVHDKQHLLLLHNVLKKKMKNRTDKNIVFGRIYENILKHDIDGILSEKLVLRFISIKISRAMKLQWISNKSTKFYYRLFNIKGCKSFCSLFYIKNWWTDLEMLHTKNIPKEIKYKIIRNMKYHEKKKTDMRINNLKICS
jgi:hypothetical protein